MSFLSRIIGKPDKADTIFARIQASLARREKQRIARKALAVHVADNLASGKPQAFARNRAAQLRGQA